MDQIAAQPAGFASTGQHHGWHPRHQLDLGVRLFAESPALTLASNRALNQHPRSTDSTSSTTWSGRDHSNHYHSNLSGSTPRLFLRAFPEAERWLHRDVRLPRRRRSRSTPTAWTTGSIPYPRLDTESFLSPSAGVAHRPREPSGDSPPLERMIEFTRELQPDATRPFNVDADDGRLHILSKPQ